MKINYRYTTIGSLFVLLSELYTILAIKHIGADMVINVISFVPCLILFCLGSIYLLMGFGLEEVMKRIAGWIDG